MMIKIRREYKSLRLNGSLVDVMAQANEIPPNWDLIQVLKDVDYPHMWTLIVKINIESWSPDEEDHNE